jgi:Amt family ammonium transporter
MKKFNGFCIGSVAFWAIGYSLMYGTSIGSVIGTQVGFLIAADMHLFFQTVFAAATATIVSIAERTKFTTYLIFSLLMTLLIYPISGSWVWNAGGWLAKWDLILPVQV